MKPGADYGLTGVEDTEAPASTGADAKTKRTVVRFRTTDDDRARLHAAIEQAQDELDRGEGIPAAEFLADLRSRRG